MATSASASYSITIKTVELGPLSLRVFLLPNRTYCLCLVDVIAIEDTDSNIRSIVGNHIFRSPILPESIRIEGQERVFTPVSIEAAILYWQRRATENNIEAQRVARALTKTSLRELADAAFMQG